MGHDVGRPELADLAKALGVSLPERWTIRSAWRRCMERALELSAAESSARRRAHGVMTAAAIPAGARWCAFNPASERPICERDPARPRWCLWCGHQRTDREFGEAPPPAVMGARVPSRLELVADVPPGAMFAAALLELEDEQRARGGAGGSDRDAHPEDYCETCGRVLGVVDAGDGSPLRKFCPTCEPDELANVTAYDGMPLDLAANLETPR